MTDPTPLGPFEIAVRLVNVGKRDPLYWDLYRQRAASYLARILPLLLIVDDGEDFVFLRMTNQLIGCLSVDPTEVTFAINDRSF